VLAGELMPTRNKIASNIAIFTRLDEYCAQRDDPISNAGTPRWIATDRRGRDFLVRATLAAQISFSNSVKIARFDVSNQAYFVTSGLETSDPPGAVVPDELNGGILTTVLSELAPRPAASSSAIRNVVEVADRSATAGYDGHDPLLIAGLFPNIQVFSIQDLVPEETLRVFFLICLADRRRLDQWIDARLAAELVTTSQISTNSIPYEILCRSVLDMDPAALFLGLYRCLEALYAHAQSTELMTTIGIERDWVEMAMTLESSLGWYPREEPSLEALLSGATPADLRSVADALREAIPADAKESSFVAKRIYHFRNALVHYRPFHRNLSTANVGWNRLCEAMARLVRHANQKCSTQR
jgi:hypothetical protein